MTGLQAEVWLRRQLEGLGKGEGLNGTDGHPRC